MWHPSADFAAVIDAFGRRLPTGSAAFPGSSASLSVTRPIEDLAVRKAHVIRTAPTTMVGHGPSLAAPFAASAPRHYLVRPPQVDLQCV